MVDAPEAVRFIAVVVLLFSAYTAFLGTLNLVDGFIGGQVFTAVAFAGAICGALAARSIWRLSRKIETLRRDDQVAGLR